MNISACRTFTILVCTDGSATTIARYRRDAQKALREVRETLEPLLKKYPNLWIEDKNSSLSVHLLHVPKARHEALREKTCVAVLQPFQRKLHAVGNIRDVEILPRSIPGKGLAVKEFLRDHAEKKSLPFYFGDDYSDESGFVGGGTRGVGACGKAATDEGALSGEDAGETREGVGP